MHIVVENDVRRSWSRSKAIRVLPHVHETLVYSYNCVIQTTFEQNQVTNGLF